MSTSELLEGKMSQSSIKNAKPKFDARMYMNLVKLALAVTVAVAAVFLPNTCYASNTAPGNISTIIVNNQEIVFFNLSGDRSAVPPCASSQPVRWAINVSTPSGQAMLSTLLTVYSSNKTIEVVGTGACADWGDTESITAIVVVG